MENLKSRRVQEAITQRERNEQRREEVQERQKIASEERDHSNELKAYDFIRKSRQGSASQQRVWQNAVAKHEANTRKIEEAQAKLNQNLALKQQRKEQLLLEKEKRTLFF